MEGNVGKFSEGEGSMAEGENSIYMWWRAEASSPETLPYSLSTAGY